MEQNIPQQLNRPGFAVNIYPEKKRYAVYITIDADEPRESCYTGAGEELDIIPRATYIRDLFIDESSVQILADLLAVNPVRAIKVTYFDNGSIERYFSSVNFALCKSFMEPLFIFRRGCAATVDIRHRDNLPWEDTIQPELTSFVTPLSNSLSVLLWLNSMTEFCKCGTILCVMTSNTNF